MGFHRCYVTGHIWWLGLKYVTSQIAFCGLYVGILTSPLRRVGRLFRESADNYGESADTYIPTDAYIPTRSWNRPILALIQQIRPVGMDLNYLQYTLTRRLFSDEARISIPEHFSFIYQMYRLVMFGLILSTIIIVMHLVENDNRLSGLARKGPILFGNRLTHFTHLNLKP